MRLAIRIVAFFFLFLGLNWLYKRWELTQFLDEEASQVLQVRKIANCDVIYISESSNFSPDNSDDFDRRKLSQFIADFYPDLQFEAINLPASHAGIYRQLLHIFPENNDVKTLIVAVNLRSFNANWINSKLETPLNKSAVMYNNRPPLFNRFLISLNAYDDRSIEEREKIMLNHWEIDELPFAYPHDNVKNWTAEEKWGDWQHPKRQLADHFIKQYAYVIDEDNPRIKDLDEIVTIAKSKGWNLMFHILAEDIDRADELVGPQLPQIMRSNSDWITQRYLDQGITVVNNLELLPSLEFAEEDFPSEHYFEKGRKALALNVALELEKFYADQFKNAPWVHTQNHN
ncbi:MAG: hypothetical protein R2813_01455 [Flavobacteriales bacterium]